MKNDSNQYILEKQQIHFSQYFNGNDSDRKKKTEHSMSLETVKSTIRFQNLSN